MPSAEELQKQLAYYKKQLDEMSGESIQHDFTLSSLRHQLKQKKEALSAITYLHAELTLNSTIDEIFAKTVKCIKTQLGMDYSVVLIPSSTSLFKASQWYGFPEEQTSSLESATIEIPPAFCKSRQYILLNKSIKADETVSLLQNILIEIDFNRFL